MRQKKIIIMLLLFTHFITSVNADKFQEYGFTIVSKTLEKNQIIYQVSDGDGPDFTIITEDLILESNISQVIQFKNLFTDWNYLTISNMTFVFYAKEMEINIIPKTFEYKGVDFTKYISAGMSFFHTNVTEYNFRLYINDMYPRISGKLISEEKLCEEILAVIKKPTEYVEDSTDKPADTGKLENEINLLKQELSKVKEEVDKLREEVAALQNEQDELVTGINSLKEEDAVLHRSIEKLRRSILILHNTGIFGNIKAVNEDGIQRILELKKENPQLLQEEAAAILRKEGIGMTLHEIFLIFSVYFNEFK